MCTTHGNRSMELTSEQLRLMEENVPLVKHIVFGLVNAGLLNRGLTDDAIQEGMIGLMNAARYFDPEYGTKFATLAGTCIKQKIVCLRRREARHARNAAISLDEKIAEGNGKGEDALWNEKLPAPDDTEREGLETLVDVCVRILNGCGYQKAAEDIRMYALEGMTVEEIAHRCGVSKQCVQQRMRRAGTVLRRVLTHDGDWEL